MFYYKGSITLTQKIPKQTTQNLKDCTSQKLIDACVCLVFLQRQFLLFLVGRVSRGQKKHWYQESLACHCINKVNLCNASITNFPKGRAIMSYCIHISLLLKSLKIFFLAIWVNASSFLVGISSSGSSSLIGEKILIHHVIGYLFQPRGVPLHE